MYRYNELVESLIIYQTKNIKLIINFYPLSFGNNCVVDSTVWLSENKFYDNLSFDNPWCVHRHTTDRLSIHRP